MDRTLKTTDLFTLVGMMMTLVGIFVCLFFLFTPVAFGAAPLNVVVNSSPDFQLSMRWIQPIVGQAIVEDALIKQKYRGDVSKTSETRHLLQPLSTTRADSMKDDQMALVQWVIGRLIVELTSHRMESGLPASDQPGDQTNQRIMTLAQRAEQEFNEILRAEWQNTLEREMIAPRRI